MSDCCCFELWIDQTVRQDVRIEDSNEQGVTGATVTATILDYDSGIPVTGIAWPVSLSEIGGGVYRFELDTTPLNIEVGQEVILQIDATLGTFIAQQSCWTLVKERSLECV